MIKLVITPVLDEGGKARGIVYSNLDSSVILFPKNLSIWSIALKKYYTLNTHEILSPAGSYQVSTRDQGIRLLSLIQDEQVVQETAEEMSARLKDEDPFSTTEDWVSGYFNIGEGRLFLSPEGEAAVEELLKPAGFRYSKTPKGKLTQKRWRESPQGKETLDARKVIRKGEKDNFKAASKWIRENPGRTFSDWEDHCNQEES